MIKVLIVDDDKLARKGIVAILPWNRFGMEIAGDVQNGRAALEFLKEHEVDIMFIDIDMPELGGIELMEITRKEFPDVQFVVLTFYEEFAYAQAAIRFGVLDYISKVQMEKEDGEAILERVLHNYKEREKNIVRKSKNQDNNKLWCDIEKQWQHFYWLYDGACFEKLLEETKQLKPDNRKLERLLVKCIQNIDHNLGREDTVIPFLTETELILDWLVQWREALYCWIDVNNKKDTMQICIMRAVQYLEKHLTENLKAEEVADTLGWSRSYFSISFKKYIGKTFHDYVKSERMRLAAGLLTGTDRKIIDIAKEAGYDDINYFNRVFHEEMKRTPTEYRKNYKI